MYGCMGQIDRGGVWTPLHIPTDKASRGVGVGGGVWRVLFFFFFSFYFILLSPFFFFFFLLCSGIRMSGPTARERLRAKQKSQVIREYSAVLANQASNRGMTTCESSAAIRRKGRPGSCTMRK